MDAVIVVITGGLYDVVRVPQVVISFAHCCRFSKDTESRDSGWVSRAFIWSIRKYSTQCPILLAYRAGRWSVLLIRYPSATGLANFTTSSHQQYATNSGMRPLI